MALPMGKKPCHLLTPVVAQRIVHGAVQHLELLFGPAVAMTLSIADGSAIIPAFP